MGCRLECMEEGAGIGNEMFEDKMWCGRVDQVRKERLRERCSTKNSSVKKAEEDKLKWFGHVDMERMSEERWTKRYMKEKGKTINEMEGWSERH